MKNKALTYILLIVVAIVWYQVFFRVKGNWFGEDEELAETQVIAHDLPSLARDTVELDVSYRDPFGITKRKAVNLDLNAQSLAQAKRPKPQKQQIVWPVITYFGMLQKTYSNKPLAIVSMDGIRLMLRKGEEVFDGVYIVKITRESITLKYKKELKEVFK